MLKFRDGFTVVLSLLVILAGLAWAVDGGSWVAYLALMSVLMVACGCSFYRSTRRMTWGVLLVPLLAPGVALARGNVLLLTLLSHILGIFPGLWWQSLALSALLAVCFFASLMFALGNRPKVYIPVY